MKKEDCEIGNTAQLISSGPAMTIASTCWENCGKHLVKCVWFDKHAILQESNIDIQLLNIISRR